MPAPARAPSRALVVLALLVAAGLLAVATVAFVKASDDKGTTKSVRPPLTPVATATSEPTAEPTPEPTLTTAPTPSATATATPTATATATATVTATVTPGTTTYAYPSPTRGYEGLALTATKSGGNDTTGSSFHLAVKGTDGDGEIYLAGVSWGDGTSVPAEASPQHCKAWPPLTSPPGPYAPEPDHAAYGYDHSYSTKDDYVITVWMSSVSKDCKPHGPKSETRQVQIPVTIVSASPSPTPS